MLLHNCTHLAACKLCLQPAAVILHLPHAERQKLHSKKQSAGCYTLTTKQVCLESKAGFKGSLVL